MFNTGRTPPYDIVLMFKILILQRAHDLSDDECEHQILDRTSFQRFLGLTHEGTIPDAKTIWKFRERLGPEGTHALFEAFAGELRAHALYVEGVVTRPHASPHAPHKAQLPCNDLIVPQQVRGFF